MELGIAQVQAVKNWPASFQPYRRAESNIVIDSRFKLLASEIARGTKNPASELDSVMSWVQDNLTYDHADTSLVANSEHALLKKRGDCSDYHGLCSSLGRALGVPTRVTYGIHLFPKNYPGHCKLEAFLAPYGWVSFDVSETQKLIKSIAADTTLDADAKAKWIKAANQRTCSGFRDNTWLLCTKGTEYDLAPPASRKVPLVSSIYAEIDGKPLPTPDAANPNQKEFAWMTAHQYKSDKPVQYPFSNRHGRSRSKRESAIGPCRRRCRRRNWPPGPR